MKKGQLRQLVLSLGAGIAVFLVLALALRWSFLFSAALGDMRNGNSHNIRHFGLQK